MFFTNPLSKANEERVIKTTNEICEEFIKEFRRWYSVSIVKKCKEEAKGPDENEVSKFQPAPPSAEPLKKGNLLKSGEVNKNYKRRYFIVWNAKSNFKIEYYENEGGALKGVINASGYYADTFDASEQRQFGNYGIKLVPFVSLRRTWYLRAESNAEKEEWLQILDTVCSRSEASRDADPCVASAFDNTLEHLRHKYGDRGFFFPYGTELDRLNDLVELVINRDVISFANEGTRVAVAVRKIISELVSITWGSAASEARQSGTSLEVTARSNMKQVMEQEVQLKGRIIELVASSLRPFIAEHGARTLRPILENIATPLSVSFAQAVQAFHATLSSALTGGDLSTPPKRRQAVRNVARQVDFYWNDNTLLANSARTIANLYSHNPMSDDHFAAGGFSLSDLKHVCVSAVRDLSLCALNHFLNETEEATTGVLLPLLNASSRLFLAEAKRSVRATLVKLLLCVMRTQVASLWGPAAGMVQPVQCAIDVLPAAGLAQLLHLNCLLREVVQDVVDRSVAAAVDSYRVECEEVIDRAQAELLLPRDD